MNKRARPISLFDDDDVSETLKQIPEDIKNRSVAVISIAGAFRLGKSFTLNFLLRYMKYFYLCTLDDEKLSSTLLGDDDRPLEGFSWRSGSEGDTMGILMWSEIFPVNLPNGEKMAVIFLDTQGTFDNNSSFSECSKRFALSNILSSVQVYNVTRNIKEDDLQYLRLFAEYGRLAAESTANKSLQNRLQFLVRDWSCPYEFDYGSAGGQEYVNKILKTSDKPPGLASLRNDIKLSFSDIKCFLMPYPGAKVATDPAFNGKLSDMETNFKTCLIDFVTELLSPENMIPKEINSQKINVNQWFVYLKRYISEFSDSSLPEPKSLFEATADANNLAVVAEIRERYYTSMKNAFETEKYLKSEEIRNHHVKCKEIAIEQFRQKRKMGTEEFCESHRLKLEENIRIIYEQIKLLNECKKKAWMQTSVVKGKEIYNELTLVLEKTKPYLSCRQFKDVHKKYEKKALDFFNAQCEENADELSVKYRQKLKEQIDTERLRLWAFNKHKAESYNHSAMISAKETYYKEMLEVIESSELYRSFDEIKSDHLKYRAAALEEFSNKCVDDADELSEKYKDDLKKDLDNGYLHFKSLHNNKKLSTIAARHHVAQSCENADAISNELEKRHLKYIAPADNECSTQLTQYCSYIDPFNCFHKMNKADAFTPLADEAFNLQMMNFEGAQQFVDQKCKSATFILKQVKQFKNIYRGTDEFTEEFTHMREMKLKKDIKIRFESCNEHGINKFRAPQIQNGIDVRRRVREFGASVCSALSGGFVGSPLGPLFGSMRAGFPSDSWIIDDIDE